MSLPEQLRAWRKEHPKTDFALGFVPYVGTALAVDDFIQDPSLLGAAGLALGPAGKLVSKLRNANKLGIVGGRRTYHASPVPIEELKHDPSKMFQGEGLATEGPGFYLAQHPGKVVTYMGQGAQINPEKAAYLHQYHLPDEEVARFAKPYDLASTHPETLAALQKMYPDKTVEEMQAIINKESMGDSLLPLAGIDPHGANSNEELVALLEKYREHGIPGVETAPTRAGYLVSHFPERLRALGGPKKVQTHGDDADWMAEFDMYAGDELTPDAWMRREAPNAMNAYRAARKGKYKEFLNPDD